jgi:hypothetical protein
MSVEVKVMVNRFVAICVGLIVWPAVVQAEAGKEGTEKSGLGLWNVESMVDQAAKTIIQRYNLNEEQAGFTRKLMARRVNQLLDKHQDAVRNLFTEALAMRTAGKAPNTEAITSWAQRAMPIYEDAKKLILEGNEEWAQILTPEQKKTHDIDIRMMKIDFAQYEQRLNRWSNGGFDAAKDWVVPQAQTTRPVPLRSDKVAAKPGGNRFTQRTEGTTPRSVNPPPNAVPGGPPRIGDKPGGGPTTNVSGPTPQEVIDPERFWDVWVTNFVRQCKLDEAQATQSRAILKDCKEKASHHREAHREDYVRLQNRMKELRASGGGAEAMSDVTKELADLNGPVNELFEELKNRCEQIPTSAQLEGYRGSK